LHKLLFCSSSITQKLLKQLYSNYFIEQKVDYIHKNPLESGIVEKPEEYIYSSAKNYCGEEGLLNIEFL
jgi:putative transposase